MSNIIQFMRFGLVGAVGFVIDAGVLSLLINITQLGPYISRIISYLCAATVTWLLNRTFTFAVRANKSISTEWLKYISANLLGALLNYGIYSILVMHVAIVNVHPVLGVAAGSFAGMLVNFSLSRIYVFDDVSE